MAGSILPFQSDARLLRRIERGDDDALVELYQSARAMVLSFVLRNHGTPDDAKDLLQEALAILWERVREGTFEHKAKLTTFLFGTARILWLHHLSRRRRETPGDIHPNVAVAEDPSPLEELIQSEEASLVRDALVRLGEPCRSLLLMFYWEERSMEEIAARLGFANADTAKSKKYQCKKALEEILKGN